MTASLFLEMSPYWGLWPDSSLCVMTHRLGALSVKAFSIRAGARARVCVLGEATPSHSQGSFAFSHKEWFLY
jgi:hypothetical protein